MNRSIKFRIWDDSKKEMLYEGNKCLDSIALTFDGRFVEAADTDLVVVTNELGIWKLMQFTGLRDKNSKEIYEGDIVKSEELVGEICFNVGKGQFEVIIRDREGRFIGQGIPFNALLMNEWEVVGTTYEDPELTKN